MEVTPQEMKSRFIAWECEALNHTHSELSHALGSAVDNANDTHGGTCTNYEWYVTAYESIAFTSAFCENADVREWFEVRGYRW